VFILLFLSIKLYPKWKNKNPNTTCLTDGLKYFLEIMPTLPAEPGGLSIGTLP
jgi:hypothetical protein